MASKKRRGPSPDYSNMNWRYDLTLSGPQARAFDGLMEGERLFYNGSLDEWVKAYKWACLLASKLGLSRYSKAAVDALDPSTFDAERQDTLGRLRAWQSPSFFSQDKAMSLRNQKAVIGEVVYGSPKNQRRWTAHKVHDAIQAFFRRVAAGETPGYPRYRAMGRWRSFGYHEFYGGIAFDPVDRKAEKPRIYTHEPRAEGRLTVEGIPGTMRVRMHRPLPEGATVQGAVLTKTHKGYRVTLSLRVKRLASAPSDESLIDVKAKHVLGGDSGVMHVLSLSDGTRFGSPRFGEKARKEVASLQRAQARCTKGSVRHKELGRAIAKLMARVANGRETYAHQVSSAVVKRCIANDVRALSIERNDHVAMTRTARGTKERPGRNVRAKARKNFAYLDASPSRVARYCNYKAERAGFATVWTDPYKGTTRCFRCEGDVPKPLRVRTHDCPHCGWVCDRDVNAAKNSAKRAVAWLRARAKVAIATRRREARKAAKAAAAVATEKIAA